VKVAAPDKTNNTHNIPKKIERENSTVALWIKNGKKRNFIRDDHCLVSYTENCTSMKFIAVTNEEKLHTEE
jgi:hypothetical protein